MNKYGGKRLEFQDAESLEAFIEATCSQVMTRARFLEWIEIILEGIRSRTSDKYDLKGKIWKRFYEEFLPLGRLLGGANDFTQDCQIQLFPGDQSFDAQVRIPNKGLMHIEVTFANDGHLWDYIYKHMKEFGHAPIYTDGGVAELKEAIAEGEPSWGDAAEFTDVFQNLCDQAQNCLDKKCLNEAYKGHQPIALVIYIDDGSLQGRAELEDLTRRLRIPASHPFEKIFLIGSATKDCVKIL